MTEALCDFSLSRPALLFVLDEACLASSQLEPDGQIAVAKPLRFSVDKSNGKEPILQSISGVFNHADPRKIGR